MKRRGFLAGLASFIPACLVAKEAKLEPLHPAEPDWLEYLGKYKIPAEECCIKPINGIVPDGKGEIIIDGVKTERGACLFIHEKNARDNGVYDIRTHKWHIGEGPPGEAGTGRIVIDAIPGDSYVDELEDQIWVCGEHGYWIRLPMHRGIRFSDRGAYGHHATR